MASKLWVKSHFKGVRPQVEQFLLQFTDKRELKPAVDEFRKLYEKARVEQLSPSLWSRISNTESWNTRTLEQMERLFKKNRSYGEVSVVLQEIYEPRIRCPLVVKMKGQVLLVEGETRLMVARVMKLTPVRAVVLDLGKG